MLYIYVSFVFSLLSPLVFGYLADKYNWFGFAKKWPNWVKMWGHTLFICLVLVFVFPDYWTQEIENIAGNEGGLASFARVVGSILVIAGYVGLGIRNKWAERLDKVPIGKRIVFGFLFMGLTWVAAIAYMWLMF
ncbi:MAG: hypothetical protein V7701_06935 [Sneathiella sp.]